MVLWGLLVVSCSSIDCPLNNRVYVIYKLQGDETPLSDSLTISTNRINRNDTVLLNHVVNTDSFQIPISYQRPEDVLYFRRSNSTGLNMIDTVIIKKEDVPHFESIDCGFLQRLFRDDRPRWTGTACLWRLRAMGSRCKAEHQR